MHVGSRTKLAMALILIMTLVSPGMALAKAHQKGSGNLNLVRAGSLTVGSDTTYPPMEFSDLKHPGTYVGADIDLANALAKALGLKGRIVSTLFPTIIPSLQRRNFDVIMSSMSDTPDRRKQIAFVDYMKLRGAFGIVVNKSSSVRGVGYKILCGHSVAVQSGTTELADLQAADKKCKGSKINIKSYTKDTDAFGALRAGHADAYTGDYPVDLYYAHTYSSALRMAGKAFGSGAFYGIGLVKSNKALKAALQKALSTIKHNGTYAKILSKWGIGKTAI